MENAKSAKQPSTTKYELELSPEMATMIKGLGISPSTKISSPKDLEVFARIGSMGQQFGTHAVVKAGAGPVTNQTWCSARSEQA